MRRSKLAVYAWTLLAYNLAVILWGAYVRATGSGAGCGAHWPLCDGQVVPLAPDMAQRIEFAHRVTSGLVLPLVLVLLWWTFRSFSAGHPARLASFAALVFTVTEGLVGAGLVLFGLVAENDSVWRAVAMAVHLVNTFLLLAALTLAAWWAGGGPEPHLRGQGALVWGLALSVVACVVLAVSGAVTALGDTLFPAKDSMAAIRQGLSSTGHFLERLRVLHPLLAMSGGMFIALMAGLATHVRPTQRVRMSASLLGLLLLAQTAGGFVNIALKAPVWMQLVHLLVADLFWISLVLLVASAVAADAPHVVLASDASPSLPSPSPRPTLSDYVALTKPRVVSLLLFTALAAMFVAKGGWPGLALLAAVFVGGYLAAGGANAINMAIDRDIDGRMSRTAQRPVVRHAVSANGALGFGLGLGAASFALLWWAANLLAALLALAGLVFYVIVYTLVLKRRTWYNIVLGGAAGCFPPLVGWAAVTGELSVLAWYLFAIIFLWTPVHFWALALLIKDDYARAGIPMAPVVLGERATVVQIAIYAVATAAVSVMPWVQREVGGVYLVGAVALNLSLLARSVRLLQTPGMPQARSLFKYSLAYLALLFLVMAVDRAIA